MKRLCLLLLVALLAGCASTPTPPAPTPAAEQPSPQPPATATPEPAPTPAPPPPPAPPQVTIQPVQVLQGEVAVLQLDKPVAGDLTVKVTGLNEQPKVFRLDGRPAAFLGFPAAAKVGTYPVTVTWPDGSWEGSVEVVRKQFTEDRLVVTEQQEATYYDPRQDEEWARLYERRSRSLPAPQWDGPFQYPLAGDLRITTYFGEIRFVNGVETGRHSGMDFGAPEGTPVLAPAPGRVILTENMIVSGHTIVIDHGMNLFTAYYHCSAIDVAVGDWVETGQVIGKVGNTGFSTGPHLHWTATIGNTPVNAWSLTEAAPMGVRRSGPVTEE
jgi:hypothetical protein